MPPKGASKTKQSAAAAKRKADDDSGDDAGEGPSKGPKETQGQRDERLLKEKTDPYYRPAAERDNTDEVQQSLPPTAPSDQWVNILAVHLASESAFIDYMKNPGDLSDVIISNQWLASVYLPGRTTYWPAFKNWYARWWAVGKRQPNGHRFKVLARASQIVADCMLPGQSSIKGTIAPLPENDDKTAGLRQNLFQIHATHSKLKELTRNLTDNQHGLSVALVDILHKAIDDTTSGDRDDLVKELTALDTVKSSAKEVLMKSRFNDTGLKLLDDFLELVPEHDKCGILSELNKGEQFPIFASVIASHAEPESQLAEEFVKGYEEIAAEIREKHQIKIDFLADKELNKGNPKDVCHVRSSGKRFGNVQTSKPLKNESIASKGMLGLIEQECSKWLSKMAEKFDKKRFELNFRDFESLTTRPDGCANASIGSSYWIRKHNHLEIARDNIVHVRRLVSHLRANNMISDEEALQKVLRRMYAFLALMHGCVAEGAIMLTVMDRLLEDLASVIIGNLDPKLESEKMQRAMTVIHEQTAERKAKLNMNDQMRHEREHKAREVFAEIVRFYHGAVILLFSAASAGKSDQAENQTVLWYQGIIDLSSKCGNSKCADQLEVKKIAKVTDTSSERWALSIAVKDARIGFPEERSMVSTNRKFTYPCLYDIVMGRRYHVAYAPFFHYFAHLWHPACRAFRGKGGLLDDMLEFEGTQEAQTQAPSNDDDEMLLGWCASP